MNKFNKSSCFFIYFWTCFFVFSFLILSSKSGFSVPSPQVWNLSDANPVFVGREKQLQIINSFFIRGEGHVLALTGGSGFGKTQIAKEYAQKFSANYDLIWWFDAQQDLPSQFKKLAIALNKCLPEQRENHSFSTLSRRSYRCSKKCIESQKYTLSPYI